MSDLVSDAFGSEQTSNTRNRLKLYAIAMLANVSAGLYTFAVPRTLAENTEGVMGSAASGSALMIGYGLTAYASGHLSDRLSRRAVITTGAFLGTLVCLGSYMATTQNAYYPLIFLLGIANGMIYPPTIGALTSGCPPERSSRVLLLFTLSWNGGLMIGSFAGGLMLPHGIGRIFLLGVSCLAAVTLLATRLQASSWHMDELPKDVIVEPTERLKYRWFAAIGWTGLIAGTFLISIIQFVFPKLARILDISEALHGYMLTTNRLLALLTYIALTATVIWRYRLWSILAAAALGILCFLPLLSSSDHQLIFVAVSLSAIFPGVAYFMAIYYGANAFEHSKRGKAGGIHESLIALGFAGGPVMSAFVSDYRNDVRAAFSLGIAVIVLATAVQMVLFILYRQRRKQLSASAHELS